MELSLIWAGLVSIAKAIPAVQNIIQGFIDFWIEKQLEEISKINITVMEERKALMTAIREAKTNEERKALSVTLYNLNNPKRLRN